MPWCSCSCGNGGGCVGNSLKRSLQTKLRGGGGGGGVNGLSERFAVQELVELEIHDLYTKNKVAFAMEKKGKVLQARPLVKSAASTHFLQRGTKFRGKVL